MPIVVAEEKEFPVMCHLAAELSEPKENSITKQNTAHATSTYVEAFKVIIPSAAGGTK